MRLYLWFLVSVAVIVAFAAAALVPPPIAVGTLPNKPPPQRLEGKTHLVGMFRYMADAARFRDCRSGVEWPVAMTGDYLALERAYSERRSSPGAEMLISLDGRIERRPKMEGAGTESTLVVERFVEAMPGATCADPQLVGK